MQTHYAGQEIEVLIVGAGPAGLMMACQLALHHIRFRIIDKKEHPTNYSGALIIQARSVEILHQMGIAQKVIQQGIIANNICILFNGKSLLKIPVKNIGSGLTPFPYLLMVEQSKTEQLLTNVINDHGFRIERGTALVRFSHDKQGVTAQLINQDGKEETVKAQYLIAADGGQSTIRKQLKIPFIGKAHQKSLFIMDCKARTDLLSDEICFSISDKTISGFFPLINGKWRIDGTIPVELESKELLTFDDVEKHFSERIRMSTKLYNPDWFSVFHSHQSCATSFQQSCCFLIGDAAHVHSPIGAQGMNSGIQDAFNLGWKLAFVLRRKAKPGLLDSYTTERLPIAQNIIRTTDHVFNLATSDRFFSKTFRLYLFPLMVKSLFPILGNRNWIRQYFFKSISEIGIQYRKSVLSHQAFKDISLFRSPIAGDRLPYILFYENGKEINIQEKVKGTSFHLFLFTRDLPSLEIINLAKKYNHILSFEIISFSFKNNHLFKRLGIKNNGCCLVRPDLYIAFQSDKPQAKELESYLEHFFELR
jgi:2-polyprenyl-6-methoxyphenol hydroxylase-like FAD-dependent oxidoreductase